jgi:DNA polymerase-1
MELLPIWNERLKNIDPQINRRDLSYILKKSLQYYSNGIKFVKTRTEAKEMLAFLKQRSISHIGFDTEFKYDSPGAVIDKRNTAYDPRSIRPLLLSLAIAEPDNKGHGCLYRFVVDLRNPDMGQYLNEIFRFPVCFCGHYSKVEIFCLWQLGLTAPDMLWDTFIFEKTLHLGRNHQKYKLTRTSDDIEEIRIKKEIQADKIFSNSLVATCQRYGVAFTLESDKERLQKSFMCHGDSAPFSTEQINYAAEDAIATAKLYPLQLSRAAQEGLIQHCIIIEMPWVITNARIEWNGVRINTRKRDEILSTILSHKDRLERRIESTFGISNIRSHKQLKEFFFGSITKKKA